MKSASNINNLLTNPGTGNDLLQSTVSEDLFAKANSNLVEDLTLCFVDGHQRWGFAVEWGPQSNICSTHVLCQVDGLVSCR
jgi:hypothetical protein